MSRLLVLTLAMALVQPVGRAAAQSLSPDQLESVRRGAATLDLREDSVTVALQGRPELPLVEVTVNGAGPYQFLVDLGSNVVIARRTVLEQAGAEMVLERAGTDIMRVPVLSIGGAEYGDVWIGAVDTLDVDGVLGYNLLSLSQFGLDFAARELVIGGEPLPTGPATLPYVVQGRMPYVHATAAGRPVLLNFDTGASNWITFPARLADSLPLLNPPVPGPTLWNNQTGRKRVTLARLDGELRIGAYRVPYPVIWFDDSVDDAWLGAALLRDVALRFDPAAQRMRFVAEDSVLPAPPLRTVGFGFRRSGEVGVIDDVVPGTPAAAVVQEGDTVVSVGGRPAGELPRGFLRELADTGDAIPLVIGSATGRIAGSIPVAELGGAPIVHGPAAPEVLAALDSARRGFSANYMAGRPAAIARAYTRSPYVLPPGGEVRDRPGVVRLFTTRTGVQVLDHAMAPEVIWAADSMIVEKGRWTQLSRRPSGELAGGAGSYVVMWLREESEWRIAIDMWDR